MSRKRVVIAAAVSLAVVLAVAMGWWQTAMGRQAVPPMKTATLRYYSVSESEKGPYTTVVAVLTGDTVYRPETPFLTADSATLMLTPGLPTSPPPRGLGWIERWTPLRLPRTYRREDYDTVAVRISPKDGQRLVNASGGLIGKRVLITIDDKPIVAPVVQGAFGAYSQIMLSPKDAWAIFGEDEAEAKTPDEERDP